MNRLNLSCQIFLDLFSLMSHTETHKTETYLGKENGWEWGYVLDKKAGR